MRVDDGYTIKSVICGRVGAGDLDQFAVRQAVGVGKDGNHGVSRTGQGKAVSLGAGNDGAGVVTKDQAAGEREIRVAVFRILRGVGCGWLRQPVDRRVWVRPQAVDLVEVDASPGRDASKVILIAELAQQKGGNGCLARMGFVGLLVKRRQGQRPQFIDRVIPPGSQG